VELSVSEELVAIADSISLFSNATRGNIPVKLVLKKPSPTSQSQAGTDGSESLKPGKDGEVGALLESRPRRASTSDMVSMREHCSIKNLTQWLVQLGV
jgi:hypothetical protein